MVEIVFCINASSIAKNKIRADFGITYDQDLLRTIDALRDLGLSVNSVVITQYADQPGAIAFRNMLEQRGVKTYKHYPIKGYPTDVNLIVSENGYGANDYIETTRPLVVVTAPGPNSGKLATCLSQLYHESRLGIRAGYAKFETFPIWNLPLKHPVNLAYEAATADLRDVNMIDPFHMDAYGETTVNYNRDIEGFPIVNTILTRILNKTIYQSPTDMGVNMAGYCITDDAAVREAATQEIVRRYYHTWCECRMGREEPDTAHRIETLLSQLDVNDGGTAPRGASRETQSGGKRLRRHGDRTAGRQDRDGTLAAPDERGVKRDHQRDKDACRDRGRGAFNVSGHTGADSKDEAGDARPPQPDAEPGRSADCALHLRGHKPDGGAGAVKARVPEKLRGAYVVYYLGAGRGHPAPSRHERHERAGF